MSEHGVTSKTTSKNSRGKNVMFEERKVEDDGYNRDFRHDKDINEIDDAIKQMHQRQPRNDRQSTNFQSMQVGSLPRAYDKPFSERKRREQIEDQ